MDKMYFSLSDEARKLKLKLLILSGVALFIGLTETLPKKLTLIGLDLSNNQGILGWFIFWITLTLLLNYMAVVVLELIEHDLPSSIKKQTDKTKGDVLGFTKCELQQENRGMQRDYESENERNLYEEEIKDINRKNEKTTSNMKNRYIIMRSGWVTIFECVVPILFSIVSICYLYQYISSLKLTLPL